MKLFLFFVDGFFLALRAVFLDVLTVRMQLLVLRHRIVFALAFGAFQND